MVVKNSVSSKRPVLDALRSSLQVPWRLAIIVDDGSDETGNLLAKFATEHGREAVVLKSVGSPPTRAIARQTAIDYFLRETSDEWLMFLDDDVLLNPGWWDEAKQYTADPTVGLIWGIDYTPEWKDRLAWIRARSIDYREAAIREFQRRGGTHDTLLRRAAIEGIKIPAWLHVYEDAYIKRYVECRGFKTAIVEVGGNHMRTKHEEGYEDVSSKLFYEADAYLCISHFRFSDVLKALFGLPGYMYYSWKAWRKPLRGLQVWRARATYRWAVWHRQNCKDPCAVVRT